MKKKWSFLTGTLITFLMITFLLPVHSPVLLYGAMDSPAGFSTPTNLTDLLKLILATIGGIASTIIIAWLKKKFPDWFGKPDPVKRNRYKD